MALQIMGKNGIAALVVGLLLGLGAAGAPAAPRDRTFIPDDVVNKVLTNSVAPADPLTERLRRHLDETSELLRQTEADGAGQTGQPFALRAERRALLESKIGELRMTREEARARFNDVRQKLATLGLTDRVKAWDALKVRAESRFDRMEQVLDQLRNSPESRRGHALAEAKRAIDELYLRVRGGEDAPSALPVPTTKQDVPVAPSTQPVSKTVPQYLTYNSAPSNNVYAFLGNTLLAAVAPVTPPEASSCGYNSADTNPDGQEIQFTPDILALAAQLEYSPVKIYRYVYDTIKFEPYYGSLKGAQGTLVSGAGNATDQASLLIALLRASNIPARYVKGQIAVDDVTPLGQNGRVPRWVGAKTYQAAALILGKGKIPAGTRTLDG